MAYKRKLGDSVDSPRDTADAHRRLDTILLDKHAHFSASRNDTTATVETGRGYTMSVTFWVAEPPEMSFFSVHCKSVCGNFCVPPHVVGAEGPFVCLSCFCCRYDKDELFVYKAGDGGGGSPTLDWVPLPTDTEDDMRVCEAKQLGIIPCGHGGHYFLVVLCDSHDPESSHYKLLSYSSEVGTWDSRIVANPCPQVGTIIPEKVIMLGEGLLCWVDFSRGLLMWECGLDHFVFIPLAPLLPENREKLSVLLPEDSARSFRDIAFVNGMLVFVEMEHNVKVSAKLSDPADLDVLFDSDLLMCLKHKYMDEKESWDGWRAVIWLRPLTSFSWFRGVAVNLADILIDESTNSSLLFGLSGETSKQVTVRDLRPYFPTLSDGILYLKSVVEPSDNDGWVVAVDLGSKTVKSLEPYAFMQFDPSKQGLQLCTLSRHLNITPGIETSAYTEITLAARFANDANNTSIQMTESRLREVKSALIRGLEEIKGLHKGAEDQDSRVEPVQNSLITIYIEILKMRGVLYSLKLIFYACKYQ